MNKCMIDGPRGLSRYQQSPEIYVCDLLWVLCYTIVEWGNTFGCVSSCKSTLFKRSEIYKGNSEKYKDVTYVIYVIYDKHDKYDKYDIYDMYGATTNTICMYVNIRVKRSVRTSGTQLTILDILQNCL